MAKVIVVGSANIDLTIAVDRLPEVGETIVGTDCYRSFGGKGANQAVAAMRAGAETTFLTMLGADDNGRETQQYLHSAGLPFETLLRHDTLPNGIAFIIVDRGGRNVIAVAPGSTHALSADDVRRASPIIAQGRVMLVQLEIPLPTVWEALVVAKAHGLLTILNPAPAVSLSSTFLRLVDVLTPNETEARHLTGHGDPESSSKKLIEQGVRSVVVTLGDQGAFLRSPNAARAFPAYRVQALDTTAAGDAFNGALASALAAGQPLEDAIVFANAAGALATTKRGAQDSLPLRSEIDRLCG